MIAHVEGIDLRNTLDLLDGGISDILVSWNEGEHSVEAYKLLDALTQLECARGTLARLVRDAEKAHDSDVARTVRDGEPSVGDVREAAPEVDIKGLASALASKARPQ